MSALGLPELHSDRQLVLHASIENMLFPQRNPYMFILFLCLLPWPFYFALFLSGFLFFELSLSYSISISMLLSSQDHVDVPERRRRCRLWMLPQCEQMRWKQPPTSTFHGSYRFNVCSSRAFIIDNRVKNGFDGSRYPKENLLARDANLFFSSSVGASAGRVMAQWHQGFCPE